MKKSALLILLLALAGTDSAFAMRCGQNVILRGIHKIEVLQKCGEPDFADERYGISGSRLRHPGRTLDIERFEDILIEEWIYNFGPRRFKQYLRFENGILREIRDLEYGY